MIAGTPDVGIIIAGKKIFPKYEDMLGLLPLPRYRSMADQDP